jgi:hypothetical protein
MQCCYEEGFEDTKGVIRIRKWKKDRQHNGQRKEDKQWSTQHTHKTKVTRVTWTLLKPGWTQVFRNGRQFLLHWWQPSCMLLTWFTCSYRPLHNLMISDDGYYRISYRYNSRFVTGTSIKISEAKLVLLIHPSPSSLVQWCGHMWLKWQLSHNRMNSVAIMNATILKVCIIYFIFVTEKSSCTVLVKESQWL